jgi:hypothetical protein
MNLAQLGPTHGHHPRCYCRWCAAERKADPQRRRTAQEDVDPDPTNGDDGWVDLYDLVHHSG